MGAGHQHKLSSLVPGNYKEEYKYPKLQGGRYHICFKNSAFLVSQRHHLHYDNLRPVQRAIKNS